MKQLPSLFTALLLCLSTTLGFARDIDADKLRRAYEQESNPRKKILLLDTLTEHLEMFGFTDSSSLQSYQVLIRLGRQVGDSVLVAKGWFRVASHHSLNKQIILSNQACYKALNAMLAAKEHQEYALISDIYTVLGFNYTVLKNEKKALQFHHLALDFINKTQDFRRKADILTNIRVFYREQHKEDSLKYYARLSLDAYRNSARQSIDTMYEVGGIAWALLDLDSTQQAIQYFELGLQQAKKRGEQHSIKTFYKYLGNAYYKINHYAKAKDYYLRSEQINDLTKSVMVNNNLSKIFWKEGDYKNAFKHYQQAKEIEEKSFSLQVAQQIFDAELHYQEALQKQELLQSQNETLQARQFLFFMLGLLIMSLITIGLFWRLYSQKRESEIKLAELNKEITAQNEEILTQTEQLSETNEALTSINENLDQLVRDRTAVVESQKDQIEQFAFMNAHQIRGPVATMLGLINMIESENMLAQHKDIEGYLKTTANKMDMMIHQVQDRLDHKEWEKTVPSEQILKT
ncbi:Tetratricopeptide repeat-containing protein [Flexibacter flexilis DSM 6793]|uniref:Tetratricopeptide repeat-containing protein n=1 Tax=Flexibacter flexilis DSM 6793 TaxID=927664 RepID=A0A1I1HM86_9BACT|nr:hypothetical protein [Flexibacter flexilis]SFC24971.1 Tetratricopeptide repeat-containing protein [Flexibacter flexilis DSM 6793]